MKKNPVIRPVEKAAFAIYGLLWRLSLPVLRRNQRLAVGFENRLLKGQLKENAHIWIQAASAGEAYLAWELVKSISRQHRLSVVLTTNTLQGKEILDKAVKDINSGNARVDAQVTYFPFDMPSVMEKAVCSIRPRVMVLLETEIWPGLLLALKRNNSPAVIVNGRITEKSLSRYRIWPALWRSIRPHRILAISNQDAGRFADLFGRRGVATMPNMKFDRVQKKDPAHRLPDIFGSIIVKPGMDFAVLGSVRQEEEADIENILCELKRHRPDAVVGLFPRHMHRVPHWRQALDRLGLPWELRSAMRKPAQAGTVILWDVFGELNKAYQCASTAFVGGSLAPLGGQNFLEPLIVGLKPVIGPHWENFLWIGNQIVDQGLVHQSNSWQDVAKFLVAGLTHPEEKDTIRQKATAYIRKRQGGIQKACELIMKYL
ncbi:MAG: glycosyltransferase N-terminal domain-containing protein [Thermodesulfobacteriota bacterium]